MPGRPRLVLASASPSRRTLLRTAGLDPEVVVSGVDEPAYRADRPEELARVLASAKAHAVARRPEYAGALVVGCDSLLVLDGEALGKPADADDAIRRWQRMRGRSGTLVTGHCVVDIRWPGDARAVEAVAATDVHFADVTDDEIAAYVATGEPLQVAGAFTLEGYGAAFVTRVEGDPSNVIGLSLPLLRTLLAELGVRWTDLWAS